MQDRLILAGVQVPPGPFRLMIVERAFHPALGAWPLQAIRMPEVNPFHWGGLLFFFEMATAFEGELLNINAFDQPGVEGYKNYMYYTLGKQGLDKKIVDDIKNHPLRKDKRFIL